MKNLKNLESFEAVQILLKEVIFGEYFLVPCEDQFDIFAFDISDNRLIPFSVKISEDHSELTFIEINKKDLAVIKSGNSRLDLLKEIE